jgi:hypothetical protein
VPNRSYYHDSQLFHRCTLPKVDTKCTAPSLIPTVNGNAVRSFSTHGQQSAARGSSTTVSRSDIRLIRLLTCRLGVHQGRTAGGRAAEAHWKLVLEGSQYAARLPIGLESVIRTADAATVRGFYTKVRRGKQRQG